MARIVRRRGEGLATRQLGPKGSKFDWVGTKRFVTSKFPVRRVQVKDPARALTNEAIAKNITNNPSKIYQPTGVGKQSPKVVRVPPKPVGAGKGHAKVVTRALTPWKRGRLS